MSNSRTHVLIIASLLTASCGPGEMPRGTAPSRTPHPAPGDSSADVATEATFDLSKCGFDKSKPGVNFSSRRLSMTPIPMTVTTPIFGGILTKTDNVVINGMAILEDSMSRTVSSFAGSVTPAVDSEDVKPILAKLSRGFSADILEAAPREKLGEMNPDWKGVFCSYQPAVKLERGAVERITVDLDKPLPVSPSVVANIIRLKAELGTKRFWKQITAKVTSSTDPAVAVGTQWTGGATSEPVAPTATVEGAAIQAEIAVKLTYDFGSPDANKALGLPKSITWYLDTASKNYKLVQIDFGDGVPVNYLPSL
jgi:hypothetical protein